MYGRPGLPCQPKQARRTEKVGVDVRTTLGARLARPRCPQGLTASRANLSARLRVHTIDSSAGAVQPAYVPPPPSPSSSRSPTVIATTVRVRHAQGRTADGKGAGAQRDLGEKVLSGPNAQRRHVSGLARMDCFSLEEFSRALARDLCPGTRTRETGPRCSRRGRYHVHAPFRAGQYTMHGMGCSVSM